MNKEELKIYKKQRKDRYERDLENLQKDFSSRDLFDSGERIRSEKLLLKKDHDIDIEFAEASSRRETKEKKRFWISLCLEGILAFCAILSALFSGLLIKQQFKIDRPYIEIDASVMSEQLSVRQSNPEGLLDLIEMNKPISYNDYFSFDIYNVGKLPAKYKVDTSEFDYSGKQTILPPANAEGVIFPNQKILLEYDLRGEEDVETRKEMADKINSLWSGNSINASKIKVFYGYINDDNLDFETLIEEKMVEKNCDDVPTPGLQCGSNPEWIMKVVR